MIKAGVIGWPIEQSRSPLIHGTWLAQYGIAGTYERIAVEPGGAGAFLRTLAERGLAGVNVTIPHKIAAFETVAEPDDSARIVEAANLVWHEGGRLRAANTDGAGFMAHLSQSAPRWNAGRSHVVILGAGGAARAIVYGFITGGVADITITNRTTDTATHLADGLRELANRHRCRLHVAPWAARNAAIESVSVIVNTTSVGMKRVGSLGLDLTRATDDTIAADIVYVPLETEFLAAARRRGLVTVDGLGMLLHQAVPAFEQFWGVRPEVTPALRAALVADIERT